MTLQGTFVNGTVVLDTPPALPNGTRVEVSVIPLTPPSQPPAGEPPPTLAERLRRLAGTVNDLPEDMAKNHDHYIHGAPKR